MKEVFVRFVLYGLTGWCVELVYTAIIDSYHKKDWNLTGKTYLWMFFVYGSAVFLFEPVHELILNFPIILRFIIWSLGITGIEFISGFLIKKVSGSCPWDYSYSRFAINEYIRWDYFPIWAVFGLILEKLHVFYVRLSPVLVELIFT
ncbi:MAG: hypothetical protein H7A25_06550 [Leptospiraceae bacterium]|nr:hypothetical protein [Leptospiraceae bacterium]MCP5499545.1 hypothetical protein [Leptospiraceae bacterium]